MSLRSMMPSAPNVVSEIGISSLGVTWKIGMLTPCSLLLHCTVAYWHEAVAFKECLLHQALAMSAYHLPQQ